MSHTTYIGSTVSPEDLVLRFESVSAQVEDSSPPGQFYCPTCEQHFAAGDRCPTDGTRLVKINIPIDPMLGRDFDGRYTILQKLGQGGMGAVYRGTQHGLNREVAIKTVSAHLVTDMDLVKRFMREAKLASRLSHPNAVAVLDFGQAEDGVFYLVMELVTGRTLDHVLKAERQLKPERVVRIGMQICDALEGAHALNIVHRDLKPANVMLLASGRDLVKVLDFGLAKDLAPDQTGTTMTNAGALLGTPAYMPPELALGQACDGRADLYSLGVMLYLCGSGKLPFESDSANELIAMHGTDEAPPMTGVPPALGKVIDRMLRKDPNERYQTAAENREALEAALENRYLTPAPGSLDAGATNPSLGPFPQASAEFSNLATPVPRAPAIAEGAAGPARSRSELHSLAVSDTMAATKKRSKLPWIGAGVVVAAMAAAGVFFVFGGKRDADRAVEATKPDTTKPDTTRPDTTKPDTTKPDTTKLDTTKLDTTKPDTTRPDTTRPDTTKPDTTRPDTTRLDTTRLGTTKPDTKLDGGASTRDPKRHNNTKKTTKPLTSATVKPPVTTPPTTPPTTTTTTTTPPATGSATAKLPF